MALIKNSKILIICLLFSQNIYGSQHVKPGLIPVSLVELLLRPEQYNNQKIHVAGYYDDLSSGIFLNKELSILSIGGDSIKLFDNTKEGDLINSNCINNYVSVVGTLQRSKSKNSYYYITDVINVKYINNGGLEFCYKK